MSKKKIVLASLVLIIINCLYLTSSVNALGPTTGYAINETTQQCGFYISAKGEGFNSKSFSVPPGWKLEYNDRSIANKFEQCDLTATVYLKDIEPCCEKLGYEYIEGNIGEKYTFLEKTYYRELLKRWLALFLVISGIVFLFIKFFKKEKINNIKQINTTWKK
ncbi:MAG: hypothetical protein WC659_02965 [Patescibacteria group bacterium]